MARLSREQVKKIIADAPPGTSPEGIIAALRADHELEGYPSDSVTVASAGGFDANKLKLPAVLAAAQLAGTALKDRLVNQVTNQLSTSLQGAPSNTGLGSRLRQAAMGTLAESQSTPLVFARKLMESAPANLGSPPMAGSPVPAIASQAAPIAEALPGASQVGEAFANEIAARGRLLSPFEMADVSNAGLPPPIAAAADVTASTGGRVLITQEMINRIPGLKHFREGETIDQRDLDRLKIKAGQERGKVPSRKIQVEGKPRARAPIPTEEPKYTGGRGASGPELARRAEAVAQATGGRGMSAGTPEIPSSAGARIKINNFDVPNRGTKSFAVQIETPDELAAQMTFTKRGGHYVPDTYYHAEGFEGRATANKLIVAAQDEAIKRNSAINIEQGSGNASQILHEQLAAPSAKVQAPEPIIRAQSATSGRPSLSLVPQEMPQLPPAQTLEDQLQRALAAEQAMGAKGLTGASRIPMLKALRSVLGEVPSISPMVMPGNAATPEQELQNALEQFLMIQRLNPAAIGERYRRQ